MCSLDSVAASWTAGLYKVSLLEERQVEDFRPVQISPMRR